MARFITIILCSITALFLLPAHGEEPEICEYEPESEIVCCAVTSASSAAQGCVTHIGKNSACSKTACKNCRRITMSCPKPIIASTAGSMLCVFRE